MSNISTPNFSIGSFEVLSDSLVVGDPDFHKDSKHVSILTNVKTGTWNAEVDLGKQPIISNMFFEVPYAIRAISNGFVVTENYEEQIDRIWSDTALCGIFDYLKYGIEESVTSYVALTQAAEEKHTTALNLSQTTVSLKTEKLIEGTPVEPSQTVEKIIPVATRQCSEDVYNKRPWYATCYTLAYGEQKAACLSYGCVSPVSFNGKHFRCYVQKDITGKICLVEIHFVDQ